MSESPSFLSPNKNNKMLRNVDVLGFRAHLEESGLDFLYSIDIENRLGHIYWHKDGIICLVEETSLGDFNTCQLCFEVESDNSENLLKLYDMFGTAGSRSTVQQHRISVWLQWRLDINGERKTWNELMNPIKVHNAHIATPWKISTNAHLSIPLGCSHLWNKQEEEKILVQERFNRLPCDAQQCVKSALL